MEIHEDTQVDEHEGIIIDEYLPRLFAPATGHWLYCSGDAVLSRKVTPQQDQGVLGECVGTEWID